MTGHFLADSLQLALSLFCCILLLWLGLTLLLNSERRSGSVLLATGTALSGSIFFAAHTALLQIAGRVPAPSLDFWWRIGWLMLVALPYAWCVIVFWFAGAGSQQRPLRLAHRILLLALAAVAAGLLGALALGLALPTFAQMLQLQPGAVAGVLGLPWFLVVYPTYMFACMALAFAALRGIAPNQAAALGLARGRAQPWMLATTGLLAAVGLLVVAAIAWFQSLPRDGTVTAAALLAGAGWFDLAVSSLLAVVVVLIGQAMVHYEVFSGRTLPRRELRRHWTYALVLAGGYGIVVGGSLTYGLRPIYNLLLSAGLMAALFALTGWRTFSRQQAFVRRLQPFVASAHLYEQLTAQPHGQGGQGGAGDREANGGDMAGITLAALCQDVLNTGYAVLLPAGPLAMLTPRPLTYPLHGQSPAANEWMGPLAQSPALCLPLRQADAPQVRWAIPLHSGGQFVGALLLGDRTDGSMYTEEEIEVAKATGERLIDLRAGTQLARRLLEVQRTRLVESSVLDRQARRVLHDDVLPDLHTALLLLNQALAVNAAPELAAAGDLLTDAHRRIAELLRSMPVRPALQAGGGLLPSLRHLLAADFDTHFDAIQWEVDEQAAELAAGLSPVTAEVVFYALREAIRNAARYGRGGDEARRLALRICMEVEDGLRIVVCDDGVGMAPNPAETRTAGSGQGLALHTALLAVVGASIEINTAPGAGSSVTIVLPHDLHEI